MRKTLVALSVILGSLLLFAGKSEAASMAQGAKPSFLLSYTTTVSTVTFGPAILYSVKLSTGASGEFVAIFDSATAVGLTSATATSVLKARCFFGSTTANTDCKFEPPLQLFNGVQAVDSAVTGQSEITFERGRSSQGQ